MRRFFFGTLLAAFLAAALLTARLETLAAGEDQSPQRQECVMIQALDGSAAWVSDPAECAVRTSPASTFKIPHALIALETGVVGPAEQVRWDGTSRPFEVWERDHTLDSAIRWSVVWFFQRTAALIGRERMRRHLEKLGYAADTFDDELTRFWLNGDLAVSPGEQLQFMARFARGELPVARAHLDAVRAALVMPRGRITNASGVHDFALDWPDPLVVRAKTGNTNAGGESVSWLVGHLETKTREYVFVSRVRVGDALPGLAGADLARRVLNARRPRDK